MTPPRAPTAGSSATRRLRGPRVRLVVLLAGATLAAAAAGLAGPASGAQERRSEEAPTLRPPERIEPEEVTELVARYRRAAEDSDDPVDWYNYGTALMRAARWEEARETLARAGPAENETVEAFTRYNQALASAESGRSGTERPEERRERLVEARDGFRALLRRRPDDEDARWNLELVQRWLREQPPGGGGEGGSGAGQAQSSGAGSARPQRGDAEGDPAELLPGEAEALLDAAGRAEASVRERLLGRARLRDPVVERNW